MVSLAIYLLPRMAEMLLSADDAKAELLSSDILQRCTELLNGALDTPVKEALRTIGLLSTAGEFNKSYDGNTESRGRAYLG